MDEIKPGDVVEIRVMIIEKYDSGYYRCRHPGDADEDCPFNVPEDALAAGRRVARPLAIGDRVKWTSWADERFIIRYIDPETNEALMKRENDGRRYLADLSDLERPAPDTKEGT